MKNIRIYNNEEFEDDVYDIIENRYDFEETLRKNNVYDYHYVFSELRENLFSWYPFKEDGSLLEIGAGYGQLTKLFCKKLKKVTSVENSEKRVEIITKRSKADNLEVLNNDFADIKTDEKYDYIVLCDIFEYAMQFNKSSHPYKDYLIYLKSFLKDDGVILIAISNRLGLKYFAGFKEEHADEYFTGIDGFPQYNNIQTFSKRELEILIRYAGFNNYKFFYPYPDHIFPEVINTDKFVNKIVYERKPTIVTQRANFFREDKLNQTLSKDGIAQYFANSFIVEIRNDDSTHITDNLEYIKVNAERKKCFRTITYIETDDDERKVVKEPLNIFSEDHILKMHNESKDSFGKINFLENTLEGTKFSYPFIEEETLENYLINSIFHDDKDEFFSLLDKYLDALFYGSFVSNDYSTEEFLEIFRRKSDISFHCQNKTNLDVIFSNIFVINDEFVSIDYEWLFDFPIPLEYVFYRVIHHHYVTNPLFRDFITLEEIFKHFNLDVNNFDLFHTWEENFLNYSSLHMVKPRTRFITKGTINKYMDKLNIYGHVEKERNMYKKENAKLKEIIGTMENSSSWKLTKPLRKLGFYLKKIFK